MAKATGKKAAAPKAAAKKAAAKKAAAPKAAKKAAAPKAAPKKAAAKKAAAPPKAAPKKAAAKKAAVKKAAAPKAAPKKVATKMTNSPEEQKPLLQKLFVDGLKDIYWAEKQLTKALGKLSKAATSSELKQAFDEHLRVTEGQIGRVEQVFQIIGTKPVAKKCEAMAGITAEAETIVGETPKGTMTRDAGLILAAQKVEHYEIASYGGLAQLAETLGLTDAKNLLGQTLDEEKEADELLTKLAVSLVNVQAQGEQGKVEEDEDDEKEDPTDDVTLPAGEEKASNTDAAGEGQPS